MTDSRVNVNFRPTTQILEALQKRQSSDQSHHQVAKRDLGRYYKVLGEIIPPLSEKEASVLVCCFADTKVQDLILLARVFDEPINDAPEVCFEGVNREEMIDRVLDWTLAQRVALLDAIERYWHGEGQSLEDVGLVRSGDVYE